MESKERKFIVIAYDDELIDELMDEQFTQTLHSMEREKRFDVYRKEGLLNNHFMAAFIVNTGHEEGLEIHAINSKAMIYVFNERTRRLITILCARPQQIRRYYQQLGIRYNRIIKDLIDMAYARIHKNLNEI